MTHSRGKRIRWCGRAAPYGLFRRPAGGSPASQPAWLSGATDVTVAETGWDHLSAASAAIPPIGP
ncbi:MAG: hypothetical protein KZQ95_12360 [Candidatus Thiodiazotropha sp. (ex Epidulcina cf. delphinae)]|nr:hypothetical protein [Candidatus Thiodiazotropha sp. (ex Epidulcina cf. delphinae)]